MQYIELIEGCIHNDKASQKAFYNNYAPIVMGMCTRYSSGEKDATQMCIYVFQKLFNELHTCAKDCNLDQWIPERVIWNAIQYLHQDKHKFFIAKTTLYEENKPRYEDMDDAALTPEVCKDVYLAALQSLTPSYRILYNLTYIDEVAHDDIIKKLQIAAETYKAELEEARFQFKKQLNIRHHQRKLQHG